MLSRFSILAFASAVLAQSNGTAPSLTEALSSSAQLSSLAGVLALPGLAQLVQGLSSAQNVTILAPSNAAFASIGNATVQALANNTGLLTALLQYHVLNGTYRSSAITNQSVFVPTLLTNNLFTNVTGGQVVEAVTTGNNVTFFSGLLANSTVSMADVNFTGGVIHVIDRFLVLPEIVSDTLTTANLTGLRGALNATNLLEAVDTIPDVTIFAPSTEAFREIGSALANASIEDIADILTYHVVNGTVGYSSGLENGTVLTALNGDNLTITIGEEGRIFVNSARVTIADILVANGVVHVIDEVLNPANATIADPSDDEGEGAFPGATAVSDLPFTSGQPTATTSINQEATGSQAAPGASSTSSAAGAPAAMKTGSVGMGALLGAAAVYAFN
ncbi:Fasciclin-domain-containing protein [Didymella exigua CBS 183.55]|uniref:Fasciclin-domain-containing protein n=1 Tax=Didymella exigua CBS 183.55 TaxID=1150837 RepID=A0A6A5S022_9PLEO|nr:Fasciclin-domain-containing protein [Didymella exigua CBS 183.55]KAF1932930.1 Fasciclin-domain-containing protein [Didymella exigua CBS 183.55]